MPRHRHRDPEPTPLWLLKPEAAERARCSTRTLERAVQEGKLKAGWSRGRRCYRVDWIDAWLAGEIVETTLLLVLLVLAGMILACACGDTHVCHLLRELGIRPVRG